MTGPAGNDGQNPPDEGAKSAVSPGELLCRARESLNLTISDLAGQTRLSRGVLEALERNDFASLAMPVYVRGYFRKCAHVLRLPEDKLLSAYAEWTGTSLKPQPLPVTVSEPPEEYVSPGRTPSWRYVVIIAVVIGAVLWWFGSGDGTPPATETGGVTTLSLEPKPEDIQPLALPPAAGEATVTGSTTAEPAGQVMPADAPAVPGSGATAPAGEIAADAATALPPPGPNTLSLGITRTSWVEIYDDDRQRLVYGLLQPGTQQRVTGRPPYQVVLGHPQGVSLSLGGKPIDLAPYTERDGTARFKLKAP